MSKLAMTPARMALLLTGVVTLFIILWPLGVGRDYMNHLARTHIEGHLAGDPILQQYFALSFDFIPDLTMDLIVPWLSHLIGTYPAGAVTVWMAFLLPPLAGLALAKTLHGRVTWLSLLGFLTVFNVSMDWGLINYAASSGLGLFAFVLWIRMAPGAVRTAVFLPLGLFLAINHAIAFLMFGFLAAAWELASFARGERGHRVQFVTRAILFDLSATLGGLIYIYLATQGADDLPRNTAEFFSLEQKAYALSAGSEFYNRPLGLGVAFIVIAMMGLALRRGWFQFAPKMGWISAGFLALVLLMPTSVMGIWGLHLRFTGILLILVAASVQPAPDFLTGPSQLYRPVFAVLMLATLVNGGLQMARVHGDAQSIRTVFEQVPRGAKLLSAYSEDGATYEVAMNASAMAVIDRSAYVPGLFTNTSPVDIQPDMAKLHLPQSIPLEPEYLRRLAPLELPPSENGYWSLSYARGWPQHWDYVALFRKHGGQGLTDLPVCEIAASEQLILYKVGECPPGT